ncbi:polyprenyl synthetase [Platysternon megacephalum]|uniref:1-acyl-sn-glycerol-3-phosphate acyltransferase n=1 Tax=Platysternon megacephalum TaxID=55544 RepID=A0A4D9DM49_9SAUR|nr:polyprenyl synthetase [Platysternon megacephalum]
MELSLAQWVLALLLLAVPLLYECSATFRYFCKMTFYNGWILTLAVLVIPLCALRGRSVENMKIIRFMLHHVKYLYGIRIEVRGLEHFSLPEPYVVVSNHQSSLDLLGMMEVLPDRCVPIAKKELMYMGTVGLACWLGGIIFINRKKTDDAIGVMSETAQTMLRDNVRVWVFPEGTRNHNGSMLPFKRGAFHLAVQAQVRPPGAPPPGHAGPGRCLIQVLAPMPTRGLGPEAVPALTERVRQAMLEAFDSLSGELSPGRDPPAPQ